MIRLLIDISHIGKACLFAAKNERNSFFADGEMHPAAIDGYDIFLTSFSKTLKTLKMTPNQAILVLDGYKCKEMRRQYLEGYCVRDKKSPYFLEEFNKMLTMVKDACMSYGSIVVSKDYVEADDIIAAFSEKMESVIWSGDKDLIACASPVFYDGEFKDTSAFQNIPKEFVVVWKSLVGDSSDKILGCPGFGEKAFQSMLEKYGMECLVDIKGMLEDDALHELKTHMEDFKPFKKIVENSDTVMNSYRCAKFYHPGYDLKWEMAYPKGNGEFPQWQPSIKLVTADKVDFEKLRREFSEAKFNSLDIETSMTPEGIAWSEANKKSNDKDGPLDVFGAVLAGVSINTGSNNHITYYFPVDHKDTNNLTLDQMKEILNLLPEDKPLIVHNTSYELPIIREHFALRFDRGYLPPLTYDSRILAGYCDENVSPGLKFWSKKLLDYDQVKYEDLMITDGIKYQMNQKTGEEVLSYAADDTITTSSLFAFEEAFTKYEDSWNGYVKVDLPAQFAYSEAFRTGVKFDMEKLEYLTEQNLLMYKEIWCNIEDFLINFYWEETISSPVTASMFLKGDFTASTTTVKHRWPGCEYVPAKKLTVTEVKRLHKICFGEELKSSFRSTAKLADDILDTEFRSLVLKSDLDGLNDLAASKFTPEVELSLRSPKQIAELLYNMFKFPVRIRNKVTDKQRSEGRREGNPSTDDQAFAWAIEKDASQEQKVFLKNILDAKSCLTENSLFFQPYKTLPHWKDGLVHPQSGQSMATSGRANYNSPNISQVSHKSPVRKVYIAGEGRVWVSMDFSSQEVLLCAWQSKDENLISCFKEPRKDFHSLNGVAIWNIDHDPKLTYDEFIKILKDKAHPLSAEVNKVRKTKAKPTGFLRQYGGTAKTLATNLLITEEEAQEMLDASSRMFPRVDEWQNEVIALAQRQLFVAEPMGRRKHISLNGDWTDKHTLRSTINFLIQGSASSQVKLVIGELWKRKIFERYEATMCFSIHDQIDFSVRKDQVVDFIREVHQIMTQRYADCDLEIQSSIELGNNLGELTEVGVHFDEEAINKVLTKL